jgi:hypothetical protein
MNTDHSRHDDDVSLATTTNQQTDTTTTSAHGNNSMKNTTQQTTRTDSTDTADDRSTDPIFTRRSVLAIGGAGLVGALAGCTGDDDNGDANDGDEEPDDNGNGDNGTGENGDGNGENEDEHDDDGNGEGANGSDEYIDEADEQVELSYGEEALHSEGMVAVAHGLEFEDQLSDFDEPDEGQYALLEFEARNEGEDAQRTPSAWRDIILLHNGSQYDSEFVSDMGGRDEYDDGEIQPDVERRGFIAFDVPSDLDESDLDAVWHDDFLGANIDVRWSG